MARTLLAAPPAAAPRRGVWPLPALLGWGLAWGLYALLRAAGSQPGIAAAAGIVAGIVLGAAGNTPWRRLIIAGGFPLSLAAAGLAGGVPGWAWLLSLVLLALAYPVSAWQDAPLFPTPADALAELPAHIALPDGARVLDAGCGLGHGLTALHGAFPKAAVEGIERSRPLALAARLRCPWARVRPGDMWAADWRGCALVYLFQRPESMARAWAKARAELAPGAWLASLEFAVEGVRPSAVAACRDGRRVWLYRIGR